MARHKIVLQNVKVHNLKGISLELEPQQLIVFTGVSGSGKSSLAFDTLYVEGQRRYIESLSTQVRRQLAEMEKPDIEYASGITPTIAIEQKSAGRNPRSTVGTMTEIYDFLRVLYARIAVPYCPVSGEAVAPQSRERIIKSVQSSPAKARLQILSPYARQKKGEFKEDFQELLRKGFMRARVDGSMIDLTRPPALDGKVPHDIAIVIDRITVTQENRSRLAEAVTAALQQGGGECIVLDGDNGEETFYSMHGFSQASGISYAALEPHDFSFNSPAGMCPRCHGLGTVQAFALERILDEDKCIAEDCFSIGGSYHTVRYGNIYDNLARLFGFSVHTPWRKLSAEAQQLFLYGTEKKWTRMHFVHPETKATWTDHVQWRGILQEAYSRYVEATSDVYRRKLEALMTLQTCPICKGSRLKPYPAAALLGGQHIAAITAMTVADALLFFKELALSPSDHTIAAELLKEIVQRLAFLSAVGLDYLTLNRTAPTLSGGESQRVRLAAQIGSGLVGITYVLDEPSIGLHPRDNEHLIATLKRLRDLGNTVIVVEHDEETILEADWVVDFGPGPGSQGGEIVVSGTLKELCANTRSLTAAYLTGQRFIPIPSERRASTGKALTIEGASHHNLKDIDVSLPLGCLIAITGVSGSGKSSLISDILHPALSNLLHRAQLPVGTHRAIKGHEHLSKIIAVDQTPIGRNPRSNPATYVKVFDEIRDLFALLPESKARGYQPGRFSFNVKEGACSHCSGMGMVKVDMDFLADAWVDCPVCHTKRFDEATLSIYYKGKNIADVLDMEVDAAALFFANLPAIAEPLRTLQQVGMGYIKLGQSSTTLSGGEAQRIKLARELVKPAVGSTLYILDEPTTGLHFHDVAHLLDVLQKFVDRGHTVVVIEHNMEVVKTADWIIDLGPEGGAGGGSVVAAGTPETLAATDSATGRALQMTLSHAYRHRLIERLEGAPAVHKGNGKTSAGFITIEGAEQNNLKHVDARIPRDKLTICTGPSGSGKSSLAFETVYAEGQRRYCEALSPYARQFVKQMPKPKVGHVDGLSPAIAIEQKIHAGNPRSTVGTMTEIYDYLRIIYTQLGVPYSPESGEEIKSIDQSFVAERILAYPSGEKFQVLAPIPLKRGETLEAAAIKLQHLGYLRVRLDGVYYELTDATLPKKYDPKRRHALELVVDRLKVDANIRQRLLAAIATAAELSGGQVIIAREGDDVFFNLTFADESTGQSYKPLTPQSFAFNRPEGMCLDCQGLGYQYGANLASRANLLNYSTLALMGYLWPHGTAPQAFHLLKAFLTAEGIPADKPLKKLSAYQLQILMRGSPKERYYEVAKGWRVRWRGIDELLAKIGSCGIGPEREAIAPLLEEHTCPSCQGSRLNALARCVKLSGLTLPSLCSLPLLEALQFFKNLILNAAEKKLLGELQSQLIARLTFLCDVGLHYLSLDRGAPTLSGGETQRIRLARQLGSGLTGVLYVLDEPTIGLHPRDNARLIHALQQLKKLGNTLLMVEHDPLMLANADYILDFGPHAGLHGGHITAKGTYKQILRSTASLTGRYLSGKMAIPLPKKRRIADERTLAIEGASLHNLKNIDVSFPVGLFTCLTGVSGSGKSTLLNQLLLPALQKNIDREDSASIQGATIRGIGHFEKVIAIDQNPVGLTNRSDVGTYVEVLDRLRTFFASLPLARSKGLQGKHFSYNHRRGMCSGCWGLGYRKVELHFLPPVRVLCEECHGLRLNPVSLEVSYQGKNFGEYLQYTIEEARHSFENHPRITRVLDTLISVGLGYLKLGQEMASLSGGEAQRIKLSRELSKRSSGRTIYLLDEPTTGLHPDDIAKLMKVLHHLVDKGNTLIAIEHNMDFIRQADYIVELGPEAGKDGGEIVYQGTARLTDKD